MCWYVAAMYEMKSKHLQRQGLLKRSTINDYNTVIMDIEQSNGEEPDDLVLFSRCS